MLTLTEIAEDPRVLTYSTNLSDGSVAILRPLIHTDAERLALFLCGLSPETRRFSTFDGYGLAAARDLCAAIARYDKLRLVLEDTTSGTIAGLFEIGLAITAGDRARYQAAGVHLTETTDCRFGPTLADAYQGRRIGTLTFPLVTDVVRQLGRTRIILWGGVLADNAHAIRFYEKNGFRHIGSFTGPDGHRSMDMMLDLHSRHGQP